MYMQSKDIYIGKMPDYRITRKRRYIPSSNIELEHTGINWVNMIRDALLTYLTGTGHVYPAINRALKSV